MADEHSFQLGLIIAKLDLASLEIGKAAWPELAFAQAQAHLDAELALSSTVKVYFGASMHSNPGYLVASQTGIAD